MIISSLLYPNKTDDICESSEYNCNILNNQQKTEKEKKMKIEDWICWNVWNIDMQCKGKCLKLKCEKNDFNWKKRSYWAWNVYVF